MSPYRHAEAVEQALTKLNSFPESIQLIRSPILQTVADEHEIIFWCKHAEDRSIEIICNCDDDGGDSTWCVYTGVSSNPPIEFYRYASDVIEGVIQELTIRKTE